MGNVVSSSASSNPSEMTLRLARAMQEVTQGSLGVLYGPGIRDDFLLATGKLTSLWGALCEVLHAQGYERCLFYTPHKGLYALDPVSEAALGALRGGEARLLTENGGKEATSLAREGPLGRRVLPPRRFSKQVQAPLLLARVAADTRLLSRVIAEGRATQTVIDTDLLGVGFFQSGWLQSALANQRLGTQDAASASGQRVEEATSAMLLVFGVEEEDALTASAQGLGLGGLVNSDNTPIARVGGPREDEMERLVDQVVSRGIWVQQQDRQALIQAMVDEDLPARAWFQRLSATGRLDWPTARERGWLV